MTASIRLALPPSSLLALATVFCLALLGYPSPSDARSAVNWSVPKMEQYVEAGASATTTVHFTSNVTARDVTVSATPDLAPYISVSPSAFPSLIRGRNYQVTVTSTAGSDDRARSYEGALQLRQGRLDLAALPAALLVTRTATDGSIFVADPEGGVYPVNELLISVIDGTTSEEVEALAALLAGEVFESFPEINAYFLRFPSLTLADLNRARLILEADSRVRFTTTNNAYTLTSRPPTDLDQFHQSQLSQSPPATVAYELVKVFEAWDLIWGQNPPLSPVAVGIIDSGIDANHPEFRPVNITGLLKDEGGTTQSGGDVKSHGTEVAGIIGAANQLSFYPYTSYQFPQMNGILAGITDDYSLHSGHVGEDLADTLVSIRKAIQEGDAQVINMSFGFFRCGAPAFVRNSPEGCLDNQNNQSFCIAGDQFEYHRSVYQEMFNIHKDVLFVAAAGNCKIEAIWHLPGGGVTAPNLISVAATTTRDTFEWVSYSNDWKDWASYTQDDEGIDIAAPGENVYAPTIDKYAAPLHLEDHRLFGGTSAAAPMVTGVAAMLKAINPELSPESIKTIIKETASPPCVPGERSGCLLDAEAAVAVTLATLNENDNGTDDFVQPTFAEGDPGTVGDDQLISGTSYAIGFLRSATRFNPDPMPFLSDDAGIITLTVYAEAPVLGYESYIFFGLRGDSCNFVLRTINRRVTELDFSEPAGVLGVFGEIDVSGLLADFSAQGCIGSTSDLYIRQVQVSAFFGGNMRLDAFAIGSGELKVLEYVP